MEYAHILEREDLEFYGALPLSSCRIIMPRLLCLPSGREIKSVLCFLVPYYTGDGENVSSYAVSRDYHLYMKELFSRICPALEEIFEGEEFVGFSDHSPIDERHAAALCGLGVLGCNHLLINEKYGSYVFIGEVLSTLPAEKWGFVCTAPEISCHACHACLEACPTGCLRGEGECLSSLTQKKGVLTPDEEKNVRKGGSLWGCDACQRVCPMNRSQKTPISFFYQDRITVLNQKNVAEMSDEEFGRRAYSWRGRSPLLRNLAIMDGGESSSK